MATNYPGALDAWSNPTSTTFEDDPSFYHDVLHANHNDAIEAIEGELGVNPSGTYATVAERLDTLVPWSKIIDLPLTSLTNWTSGVGTWTVTGNGQVGESGTNSGNRLRYTGGIVPLTIVAAEVEIFCNTNGAAGTHYAGFVIGTSRDANNTGGALVRVKWQDTGAAATQVEWEADSNTARTTRTYAIIGGTPPNTNEWWTLRLMYNGHLMTGWVNGVCAGTGGNNMQILADASTFALFTNNQAASFRNLKVWSMKTPW